MFPYGLRANPFAEVAAEWLRNAHPLTWISTPAGLFIGAMGGGGACQGDVFGQART